MTCGSIPKSTVAVVVSSFASSGAQRGAPVRWFVVDHFQCMSSKLLKVRLDCLIKLGCTLCVGKLYWPTLQQSPDYFTAAAVVLQLQ